MNQPSDTDSSGPQPTPIPLVVYRELRIGMVVIMAMLGAAVVMDWWSAAGRFQSALSEYFYTSAHGVFIGALLAPTTLFFVYKGRTDTEDAFLTLAGICTFTAALVPQIRPKVFGPHGLPKDYNVDDVVLPNVGSVVVALFLGWAVALLQYRLTHSQQTRTPGGTTGPVLSSASCGGRRDCLAHCLARSVFSALVHQICTRCSGDTDDLFLHRHRPLRRRHRWARARVTTCASLSADLPGDCRGDVADVDWNCHAALRTEGQLEALDPCAGIDPDPRVRRILGGSIHRAVAFSRPEGAPSRTCPTAAPGRAVEAWPERIERRGGPSTERRKILAVTDFDDAAPARRHRTAHLVSLHTHRVECGQARAALASRRSAVAVTLSAGLVIRVASSRARPTYCAVRMVRKSATSDS